jgi:hypothetical protein
MSDKSLKRYVIASDFDQTLSFHDSGLVDPVHFRAGSRPRRGPCLLLPPEVSCWHTAIGLAEYDGVRLYQR